MVIWQVGSWKIKENGLPTLYSVRKAFYVLYSYTMDFENNLPLVLNAIGAAIGKPLCPLDIGDGEARDMILIHYSNI